MHESLQLIEEARKIGVDGYVTKNQVSEILLEAVDAILRKESYFPAPGMLSAGAMR